MKPAQLIGETLLAFLLAIGLSQATAFADQGRGHGKGHGTEKANGLPPGLAKRDSLPPGLAKQLHERGTLPPGLQKRLTPVPARLGGRLPSLPPYYNRYFANQDLLVVDSRTNRIISIVPDVFQ